MVKKFVICPDCHSAFTIELGLQETVFVECNNCRKTGEISNNSKITELDFYPLQKPFSYVKIIKKMDTKEKQYRVIEPILSENEQKILNSVNQVLNKAVQYKIKDIEDETNLLSFLPRKLKRNLKKLNSFSRNKILYYLKKDIYGYGIIDPLMHDSHIEDISCDGFDVPLFISHRIHGSLKTNIQFLNKEEVYSYVVGLGELCGKHICIANPMMDAVLPDGSRIQMTLGTEVTAKGSTFSIRKFRSDPYTPIDLLSFKTMSPEMIVYFWLIFENGINALFAGGTASGKTTILNAFSLFIPRQHKIVSIEETREINLIHPNWIPGVVRSGSGESTSWELIGAINMYDLLKAALRQRPEYILVGEIRGEEAHVLFQAMTTGHATYSTMHADSTKSLIYRLEYEPINIPRHMLQALDVVSFHVITKHDGKTIRRCKSIVEIIGIDPSTKEILVNEAFNWDSSSDQFFYSGKSYVLERICDKKGITHKQMIDEMKKRIELVRWMDINEIRDFREVSKIISRYRGNPEETLRHIKKLTVQ